MTSHKFEQFLTSFLDCEKFTNCRHKIIVPLHDVIYGRILKVLQILHFNMTFLQLKKRFFHNIDKTHKFKEFYIY